MYNIYAHLIVFQHLPSFLLHCRSNQISFDVKWPGIHNDPSNLLEPSQLLSRPGSKTSLSIKVSTYILRKSYETSEKTISLIVPCFSRQLPSALGEYTVSVRLDYKVQ